MSQWLDLPRNLGGWAAIAALLLLTTVILCPTATEARLAPPEPVDIDGDGDEFYFTSGDESRDIAHGPDQPSPPDSHRSIAEQGAQDSKDRHPVEARIPTWLARVGVWLNRLTCF
jgi:hypothetical protein